MLIRPMLKLELVEEIKELYMRLFLIIDIRESKYNSL